MTTDHSWNAESLAVPSDDAWTAQYRRLQSWYREAVLRARPGGGGNRDAVGSMLHEDELRARPGLNFLTPEIAAYAAARARAVREADGTLEEHRLLHNMLSSMPLCFNLFGFLRSRPKEAAVVLADALNLPIATIDEIEVEWAPPRTEHLGDRTAFDAIVFYRTPAGDRGFVGIETKYTEPFSSTEYDIPAYRELTQPPVFRPGAADRLKGKATNQLWRNTLLALSLKTKQDFALGHVAVVACDGDTKVKAALEGLHTDLVAFDTLVRSVTLERLVSAFATMRETRSWAKEFYGRYLGLEQLR
jgi:hypothetical protein